MRASFGFGGWVAIDGLGLPGPLYLRLRESGGRLRIHELYLDSSEGAAAIDGKDLRELPLTRIEAFLNTYADDVKALMSTPSPDLSTMASYFATSFGNQGQQVADGNWLVASFASQQLPEGIDRAVVKGEILLTEEDAEEASGSGVNLMRVKRVQKAWRNVRESDRDFRLTSGPTEGLTDEFLRELARAYAAAVNRGERPNVSIHEQTGYPLKSVQRWVYTARQRGIMPRGQRGKAG